MLSHAIATQLYDYVEGGSWLFGVAAFIDRLPTSATPSARATEDLV